MRRFRGRGRFTRRRPLARQYRAWQALLFDSVPDAVTGPRALITANQGNLGTAIVGGTVGAESNPILTPLNAATQVFTQLQNVGSFAISVQVPLWSPEMWQIHGKDVTLKALHGYIVPRRLVATQNAVAVGGEVKCRMALIEQTFDEQLLMSNHPASVPRLNAFSASFYNRRIWWMRDFMMFTNQNPFTYWTAATGGAGSVNAKAGGNEPKMGSINGGWGLRVPRFNFKCTRGRYPVLLVGFEGNTGVTLQADPFNAAYSAMSANATVSLEVNAFLRAFVVR